MIRNKLRAAKILLIINAIIGVAGSAGIAIYMAAFAYDSGPNHVGAMITFTVVFFPIAILWSLFCYGAYKGIITDRIFPKFIFWLFVVFSVAGFPIGTITSFILIYLWYTLKNEGVSNA